MNFSQPPPELPMNFNVPPPGMGKTFPSMQGGYAGGGGGERGGGGNKGMSFFRPFSAGFVRGPGGIPMSQDDFDGKRLRKSVMRKTVDYNAAIIKALQTRTWQRDQRDRRALQPESIYTPELLPPPSYMDNPSNAVTTKFVKTATNKMRCPIFTLAWTPEGRRLVTGASSGEFTLWNGLTFNFETILQAHDVPVRTMVWSNNDNWMVTGDHGGYVKYWQSNMNNVKMFQAHKEPIRGISFSPSDNKFVSCSDDGTLRVWDFLRCQEERVLRGHGADVKCVHWHPQKALIVSGSKDNQQPIKLWDPKSGQALATLHAHKSTVMDLKWNNNGNWLITASRDHLLKLFDLRNLSEEVQIFRGHKKEASAVSWHPIHEGLFSSGGSDGSILFWNVGTDKEVGAIDTAHDSIVWTLAWHPLGHILCSGSNDHTIKFWTRNRPGDQMRDRYNLNTLPASLAGLDECDIDEHCVIPGMGPEDKLDFTESLTSDNNGFIPGLDLEGSENQSDKRDQKEKKVPYSKPIPRNFQAQWNDTARNEDGDDTTSKEIKEVITQIVENTPGVVPLQKIAPSAIIVYGKMIQVTPGSNLEAAILEGPEALNKFIGSGEIEELHDVMPHEEHSPRQPSLSSPPINKKSRYEMDHNPTFIYDQDNANSNSQHQQQQSQQPMIPSLLSLPLGGPFPNIETNFTNRDMDFRNFNNFSGEREFNNNSNGNENWTSGNNNNNNNNNNNVNGSPWNNNMPNNNNNNSNNGPFNPNFRAGGFRTNNTTNPWELPSLLDNNFRDRDTNSKSTSGTNNNRDQNRNDRNGGNSGSNNGGKFNRSSTNRRSGSTSGSSSSRKTGNRPWNSRRN